MSSPGYLILKKVRSNALNATCLLTHQDNSPSKTQCSLLDTLCSIGNSNHLTVLPDSIQAMAQLKIRLESLMKSPCDHITEYKNAHVSRPTCFLLVIIIAQLIEMVQRRSPRLPCVRHQHFSSLLMHIYQYLEQGHECRSKVQCSLLATVFLERTHTSKIVHLCATLLITAPQEDNVASQMLHIQYRIQNILMPT